MGPRPNGHSGPYQIMPFRLPTLGAKAVELCSELGIAELCKVTPQIDAETHGLTADSYSQLQHIMCYTQRRQHVATDVKVVELKGTGHWLMEERPKETMDALVAFL